MKIALAAGLIALMTTAASAQYQQPNQGLYGSGSGLYGTGSNSNSHYVQPYTRQDGTYVQGHQQTNPNNTQLDNYGTRGNVNPYTGEFGTRAPHY
jgi:opacity protein-like surface antigen